jgi:hypothetical protein
MKSVKKQMEKIFVKDSFMSINNKQPAFLPQQNKSKMSSQILLALLREKFKQTF